MTFGTLTRPGALAIAAATLLIAAPAAHAADERGTVQGSLLDQAGKPVAGGFVRLKNDARHLTFLVTSREQGHYEATGLPAGTYTVQGVATDFQSAVAPVTVAGGQSAKLDVALTAARGPDLAPAWPQRLPEAQVRSAALDLPPGEGQQLVQEKCTVCHTALPFAV